MKMERTERTFGTAEVKEMEREIWTDTFSVNMGPQHPSTHGILRLLVQLDGEIIKKVTPYPGYLHRAIEKICENRSYLQAVCFTDRVDYAAAMNTSLGFSIAAERLMGIEPPERAQYIRVIMAELNRIASHLVFYGDYGLNLGAFTPLLYAFREREKILDLFEMCCGNRLTYNYIRPGGVAFDLADGFEEKCLSFAEDMKNKLKEYHRLLTSNPIFQARTKGIGILSKEKAINYSVSGPSLRASGLKWDLRRNDPYLVYDRFSFEIPTGKNSDCFDRYMVRMNEIEQSLAIIRQAIKDIPSGDYKKPVTNFQAANKAEIYVRTEAPRGEFGVYIVSDGTNKPYRVKFRTGSFSHLGVLDEISKNHKFADLIAIFGSLDADVPEIDR